ncbi:MAG: Asp-tRNA(Asn)/Glu-tRNA(Gln) amidotransferase subunit GatB [Candidatus Omnitrophica bacterium]|jgi:aspartyl-tRNA(Asn)/glutamyl-tRNA(Gln) amidotransferase subunit B|nr:Asp-tRNA(Asn)/Glu-tRNA(Gln) amidotransferase subunit GatB [Candidatus Omnitrophota bacterium]
MNYEAVIGLEVHLHLKTKTKAFCGCSTEFGQGANSQVCPVCLGFPGSLPVLNKLALDFAIKAGLGLNCTIQSHTKFDRKNYFYPDLPKNYQISQYDMPLAINGYLDIDIEGKTKRIGITRAHLEEDAGKLIHKDSESWVDFNRTGIPLLEIVTEPDISSPQEAYEYLSCLKNILEYLEISDCDMEKGSLRCDANISLRPKGAKELGVKTELKNMNSFKGVKDALGFEIERQARALENGEKIIQETRLWNIKSMETVPMRTKEEAQDYRYFPEPDLPLFLISAEKINEINTSIPELPRQKLERFVHDYGLSEYDAKIIVSSKAFALTAEKLIKKWPNKIKKPLVNWLCGPLLSEANSRNLSPEEIIIPGGDDELIDLIIAQEEGKISHLIAKTVFTESIATTTLASEIIKKKNLFQISDTDSLNAMIEEVLKDNIKSVADYRAGKTNAVMALVGQMMKKTGGKANPKLVQELLKRRLENA